MSTVVDSLNFVFLHAGHEVTIPIQLRLAVGSLAGFLAVLVVAPIVVFSDKVQYTVETGVVLLTRNPSPSITIQAAVVLGLGLLFGAVFEFTTVIIERIRPLIVLIAGLLSVTNLLAVILIAVIVTGVLRVSASRSRTADVQSVTLHAVVIGLAYGFSLLGLVSVIYRYFGISI